MYHESITAETYQRPFPYCTWFILGGTSFLAVTLWITAVIVAAREKPLHVTLTFFAVAIAFTVWSVLQAVFYCARKGAARRRAQQWVP